MKEIVADFCRKYNVNLNEQQRRAVQAVDGANLLLAVPGSGKTTVLVARIGYMIFGRGIDPRSILAITYTQAAAEDMRRRFADTFGERTANLVGFRTINGIADGIVRRYLAREKKPVWQLLEPNRQQVLLRRLYRQVNGEFAGEAAVRQVATEIAYIKNMQLGEAEIGAARWATPRLGEIYKRYCESNIQNKLLDYDDQLVYALRILQTDRRLLAGLRRRYRYICVDEAQDTSRIQHNIIYLLAAASNNIFMVGDEDQSVYGYRAAYPAALLRFSEVYAGASVLMLERNFRSSRQIVEAAAGFIAKNTGRYAKSMTAERGEGEPVRRVEVATRAAQYQYLLEAARRREPDVAILYRENNGAVPLVDMLLREGIPFRLARYEQTLLGHTVTQDIRAFISLALDHYDRDAFAQIYGKCGLYIGKSTMEWACKRSRQFNITVFKALQRQMEELEPYQREQARNFRELITPLRNLTPIEAIGRICENGYGDYLTENQFGGGNLELLEILAERERTLPDFLARLDYLEQVYKQKAEGGGILLSTIHSCKGLEFDTVYLMDAYDDMLPGVRADDARLADRYQEERRLFYVGLTRAKNRLVLLDIKDRRASFIAEVAGEKN